MKERLIIWFIQSGIVERVIMALVNKLLGSRHSEMDQIKKEEIEVNLINAREQTRARLKK